MDAGLCTRGFDVFNFDHIFWSTCTAEYCIAGTNCNIKLSFKYILKHAIPVHVLFILVIKGYPGRIWVIIKKTSPSMS